MNWEDSGLFLAPSTTKHVKLQVLPKYNGSKTNIGSLAISVAGAGAAGIAGLSYNGVALGASGMPFP